MHLRDNTDAEINFKLIGKPQLTDHQPAQQYRPIRSFVRREGRITPSQEQALKQLWSKFGIDYADDAVDFDQIFGRAAPLSIDIGFGNGLSTAHCATIEPNWNHLGIEVHRPGVGQLLSNLESNHLSNVRVICADAVEILVNMIGDEWVDRILIFFPDPWHKKRHHKRRLIQTDLVNILSSKLKPHGVLHMATDWQPYAQWMLEVIADEPSLINLSTNNTFSEKPEYRPTTKFETRGHKLGHDVFDLIYQKA